MVESIGAKLVEVVDTVTPLLLSEAEQTEYPYATYEMTTYEHRTKDGVYKISATVYIRIYGQDFDDVDLLRSGIEAAVATMQSAQYSATLQTRNKDCIEGIWNIELSYTINQYS